jgi:hypothetical protein
VAASAQDPLALALARPEIDMSSLRTGILVVSKQMNVILAGRKLSTI